MSLLKHLFKDTDVKVKGNFAYGTYQGYYVAAQMIDTTTAVEVKVNYNKQDDEAYRQETKEKLKTLLSGVQAENKRLGSYLVSDYYLSITMNPSTMQKKTVQAAREILDKVIQTLRLEGCMSGCQMCGSNMSVGAYTINGKPIHLCMNCHNDTSRDIEADRSERRSNKSHLIPGLIGAFLGSFAGVALWVLIYYLGYIAGIAGAVMIIASMYGYEKLGGALDTKGVIVSFVISVIMIYISNKLSWTMVAYNEFRENGIDISFFDLYRGLMDLIKELDVMGDFISDLVIGYLLFIVAGISNVIKALKDARGAYKMKEL